MLPALSVPLGGASANFALPGGRAVANPGYNPGANRELLTRTGGRGGVWEMGEICLTTKTYPLHIKQKLTPLSHNDNIKATPPPVP